MNSKSGYKNFIAPTYRKEIEMKVNKYCKVNFNNPTPSKKDVDVVINVKAIDKTDGFLNFVFLMDNEQKCCEVADYYSKQLS